MAISINLLYPLSLCGANLLSQLLSCDHTVTTAPISYASLVIPQIIPTSSYKSSLLPPTGHCAIQLFIQLK